MIRSSTGGSQPRYHVPSGYTTAIGPPSQMRRQLAFVLRMPPASDSPSSLRRFLRKSHAAMERSRSQHFGIGLIGAQKNVTAGRGDAHRRGKVPEA